MADIDNIHASNATSTERLTALVAGLTPQDLQRSLGGNWTVAFALVHLAFWDARQVAALQRYAQGDGFPSEDYAANATLEAIAHTFDPATIGLAAVNAAQQLDETVNSLTPEQLDDLRQAGLSYATERAPHRDEHLQQIETALAE